MLTRICLEKKCFVRKIRPKSFSLKRTITLLHLSGLIRRSPRYLYAHTLCSELWTQIVLLHTHVAVNSCLCWTNLCHYMPGETKNDQVTRFSDETKKVRAAPTHSRVTSSWPMQQSQPGLKSTFASEAQWYTKLLAQRCQVPLAGLQKHVRCPAWL